MTAATFAAGAVGLGVGLASDNPALMIVAFWVLLIAFGLLLHRDYKTNAVAAHRPTPAHWDTLDDLYAWPTAVRGSYPPEED